MNTFQSLGYSFSLLLSLALFADTTVLATVTQSESTYNPSISLLMKGNSMSLQWPVIDGRFGVPTSTFTLPGPNNSGGMYYPDIQASFPEVDWQNIDRLYIPAAHYKYIRIGNLPDRESSKRLIITNKGGQVRVGGLGHYYVFSIGGGSNWVLTGRYDPVSLTGDVSFPGHRGGKFTNTQDTYGILVDDELGKFAANDFAGVTIAEATEFEVEYLEVRKTSFSGMSIKTNDNGSAHMERVLLHDNYIHDTASEGLYIGSTQGQPQHQIRDWQIYNNRILRTGTEALQLGQLAGHTQVHHNVIGPAAIDWRASFQNYQDSNLQIGVREGHVDIHHNIFIGAANSLISLAAQSVTGDSTNANVGVSFTDNYFDGTRWLGMWSNPTLLNGMSYRFERNIFRGARFERDEVYNVSASDHLIRCANGATPLVLIDNRWNSPENISNVSGTGSGNVKGESERIQFVNSGLPASFDYLNLEMWTDTATRGGNSPVAYDQGEVVMHDGLPYRCLDNPCGSGLVPPDNPETWQPMLPFPDDVRVKPGTTWEKLGLSSSYL